jgi:hypothetical protein
MELPLQQASSGGWVTPTIILILGILACVGFFVAMGARQAEARAKLDLKLDNIDDKTNASMGVVGDLNDEDLGDALGAALSGDDAALDVLVGSETPSGGDDSPA